MTEADFSYSKIQECFECHKTYVGSKPLCPVHDHEKYQLKYLKAIAGYSPVDKAVDDAWEKNRT